MFLTAASASNSWAQAWPLAIMCSLRSSIHRPAVRFSSRAATPSNVLANQMDLLAEAAAVGNNHARISCKPRASRKPS